MQTYYFNKFLIIAWAENALIHDTYTDMYQNLKIIKPDTFHITFNLVTFNQKENKFVSMKQGRCFLLSVLKLPHKWIE